MLTPFFNIDQDDEFIFIDVKVSHIRFGARNIEMVVNDDVFIFALEPYYLRLRLPFPCVDDERSHAEYDSKTESVKIKIGKLSKGQYFPDLDLTAKLLARKAQDNDLVKEGKEKGAGAEKSRTLIEELDVENDISDATKLSQAEKDIDEGEKFNWEIDQTVPKDREGDSGNIDGLKIGGVKYGFNRLYDGMIGVSLQRGNDINELGDPEGTSEDDRIIERLIKENIKFDPEYYAADYIAEKYPTEDDDKFSEVMNWKPQSTKQFMKWYKEQRSLPESERSQILPVEFSEDEQKKMLNLPRKTYVLDIDERRSILNLITSLLFAYHFDLRENEGDHNIESAWTLGKLTPQISFLDSRIVVKNSQGSQNVLKSNIITSIRRALCYPLHRNFNFITKVWDDVYYNMRGGKRLLLKSLLDLRELFRYHDVYYVYNIIFLDDLCAWIISDDFTEGTLRNLAHDVQKEVKSIQRTDITFEKAEEASEDMESDDLVAFTLEELDLMSEQSFANYDNGQQV